MKPSFAMGLHRLLERFQRVVEANGDHRLRFKFVFIFMNKANWIKWVNDISARNI